MSKSEIVRSFGSHLQSRDQQPSQTSRRCPVEEIPIAWHETPGGHVHLLRDSWRMARDVWRVRQQRLGKVRR